MEAAGISVLILPNGNLPTEHQTDPDSWDILGKPAFEGQIHELSSLCLSLISRFLGISGSNILHSLQQSRCQE